MTASIPTGDFHLDSGIFTITNKVIKQNATNAATYSGNLSVGGALGINGTLSTSTKNNVTQITSITTDVTVNGTSGIITTYDGTYAANTAITFIVNNNIITNTSLVFLNIFGFTGNAVNLPVVSCGVFNGYIELYLNNVTAAAYSGSILISYLIIN